MPDTPEVDALVAALEAAGVPSDLADSVPLGLRTREQLAAYREGIAADRDALLPLLAAHAGPAARVAALRVLLEERVDALKSCRSGDIEPREVIDPNGGPYFWRCHAGKLQSRYCGSEDWRTEGPCAVGITPDRVRLWADLLANPTEEVAG